MKNPLHTNKQLTALISGTYFSLVAILALMVLSGSSTAQANNHTVCGYDVCQNNRARFNINLVAYPPEINFFHFGSNSDITFLDGNYQTATQAEMTVFEDTSFAANFEVLWNTTYTEELEGAGDWSGSKSIPSGSESLSATASWDRNEETFSYTLNAFNVVGDSVSETLSMTVIDPPSYRFSTATGSSDVELDGEPGATSSVPLEVIARKFGGQVNLYVGDDTNPDLDRGDLPDALWDEDGNAKIRFSFADDDNTVNLPSFPGGYTPGQPEITETKDLEMETILPLYDDRKVNDGNPIMIPVTADAQPDVPYDDEQTIQIPLNVDGFNPRTIEEF